MFLPLSEIVEQPILGISITFSGPVLISDTVYGQPQIFFTLHILEHFPRLSTRYRWAKYNPMGSVLSIAWSFVLAGFSLGVTTFCWLRARVMTNECLVYFAQVYSARRATGDDHLAFCPKTSI